MRADPTDCPPPTIQAEFNDRMAAAMASLLGTPIP